LGLALFRFRPLDIMPIAREYVLDTMPVGVVVLDRHGRVLDMNPAAGKMLDLPPLAMAGRSLAHLGPAFPFTQTELSSPVEIEKEVRLGPVGKPYFLLQRLTPLALHNRDHTGALLLVQDITARKRAELAERAQHDLAETLRDTASDLNFALPLPEMLDRIWPIWRILVLAARSAFGVPGWMNPCPTVPFVTSRPIARVSNDASRPWAYPAPLLQAASTSQGSFRVVNPALLETARLL
jgi:PAS domain S-box-containing protein